LLTQSITLPPAIVAFLAVTAHSITDRNPVRALLSFKTFSGSHTAVSISAAQGDVIDEYSLHGKLRCIVTDNASNMYKAMDVMFSVLDDQSRASDDSTDEHTTIDDPSLWSDAEVDVESAVDGNVEHISCFSHSLQLVVPDRLAVLISSEHGSRNPRVY